jgi:hypothetical protein
VVATVVVDVVGTVVIVVGTVVVVVGTVVVGLGLMAQEDSLPPAQLHSPPRHSATMLFRHCRRALPCSPPQRVFIAGWQRFTVHLFFAASPGEAKARSPSAIDSPSLLMIVARVGLSLIVITTSSCAAAATLASPHAGVPSAPY